MLSRCMQVTMSCCDYFEGHPNHALCAGAIPLDQLTWRSLSEKLEVGPDVMFTHGLNSQPLMLLLPASFLVTPSLQR